MPYSDTRYRLINLLKQFGVAASYVLLAKMVFTLFSANGVISVIWPSSGLALAVLLIGGKRYYWSVFLGALLANAMTGISMIASVAIATGNTLEALICVWILTRNVRFDVALQSLRSYLLLILAASIGGIGGALIGAATWLLAGTLPSAGYLLNLAHWWMGDVLGIVLATPLILAYGQIKKGPIEAKQLAEPALLLGVTFLAGQAIFLDWFHAGIGQVAKGYEMFLFITLVAVRLGTRGTVIALTMTAFQALLGAYHGIGYFANDLAQTQLANYWFFMLILSVVGMALATFLTERKQTENALRESEEMLQRAQSLAHVGHYKYNPVSDVVDGSDELFRIFGLPRKQVQLSDFLPLIHPDDRASDIATIESAIERQTDYENEHRLLLRDGTLKWIKVIGKFVFAQAKDQSLLIGTVQDITERKQTENAFRDSEERLRDIMNNAPVVIFIKDPAGRYLFVNSQHEKIFRISNAAIQGKTTHDLFPKNVADILTESDRKVIHSGSLLETEVQVPHDDGIHTYISAKFPLRDSSGKIYAVCGISTDITERKTTQQQLHNLTAHLLNVREDEKIHIAREIHDDLGATLNALKMDAYWLSRKLPAHDETAALVERIETMGLRIDNAINFTRRIIDDLRPAILDDLGLLAAIEWQAAEFSERTSIECRVSCIEDEANLDKQRSIALFRILQEALTNISRHSGASRVNIEFLHNENEALLTVSDNGCGISESNTRTSKLYSSKSYGILGMKERVEQLGGKIVFGGPEGGGLSVKVILPFPVKERSA